MGELLSELGDITGRTVNVNLGGLPDGGAESPPPEPPESHREVAEILSEFTRLLAGPTTDGQAKRRKGKPLWKDDRHEAPLWRHLARWVAGDTVDPDSGSHPLVHAAWRCLALAWQEEHANR